MGLVETERMVETKNWSKSKAGQNQELVKSARGEEERTDGIMEQTGKGDSKYK